MESPFSYSPEARSASLPNGSETSTTNTLNMDTNDYDNDSYEVISQDGDQVMDTSEDVNMVAARPADRSTRLPSSEDKPFRSGFSSDDYKVLAHKSIEFVVSDWERCVETCQALERAVDPKPALLGSENFEMDLKSSGRIVSESIPIGDYQWRLIVCPAGNQGMPREEVAVFVELQSELSGDAAVCAQMIVGVRNEERVVQKPADHRFDSFERDWGFNQLVTHRQLDKDTLIGTF